MTFLTKFFAKRQRNCSNSRNEGKIRIYIEKEMIFFEKCYYGRANGSCDNPGRSFSTKGLFLAQSPNKFETMSNASKKVFPHNFARIGWLQFWQLGKNSTLKMTKRVRSESWKKLHFFSILKGFSSICSSAQLLQFWRPWKMFSPLSVKLHLKSLKPKILNNLFQKSCSASNPLDR